MAAADRAVVIVVDFFLSKNAFSSYQLDTEHRIGVNIQNLLQILRRAGDNDVMTLEMDGNRMKIMFEGESVRNFTLPLIDISQEDAPPLDKLDFSTNLRTNLDVISSGVDDAELVTDSVVLTVRKDMLTMKAESDTSSSQLDLRSGTESLKIVDMGEPVRARYSLDYLKKIFKARKIANEASIALSTDYPLKIELEVPDKIRLGFVLAPRVED